MTDPTPKWSASRPLFAGFLTLTLLVLGLGGWSVFATLSGAVIAPGELEVSSSRQVVQHPDGGVVDTIYVAEGSSVTQGDVLLRLNGSALQSELAVVSNQLLELDARRARLQAQSDETATLTFSTTLLTAAKTSPHAADMMAGQASLFTKQAKALDQAKRQRQTRIEQIRNQINGITAQQQAVDTQIKLLSADLARQQDLLAAGLTQAARVSAIERDLAELTGQMGLLTSSEAEAQGGITEIEIEISALDTQHRERAETELRDVVSRLNELAERETALRARISRLDVRAPVSGIILGLQVTTPQSVVRPAEPLMFIVPQDRPLLVVARVPITHVDEVHTGQPVRLVFSSLPSRTTPELVGTVTLISADSLSDERTGASYFRAEITLDTAAPGKLGTVTLLPGMPVSAFIKTQDRSPLAYLLKPFIDYFRTAFRES